MTKFYLSIPKGTFQGGREGQELPAGTFCGGREGQELPAIIDVNIIWYAILQNSLSQCYQRGF